MQKPLDVMHNCAKICVLVADAVPGAFTFLGIHNESAGSVHGLHTPQFLMDDSQLPRGAALHAAVAVTFFQQNAESGGTGHTEL